MYIVILEQRSNTGKANSDSGLVRFGDEALIRYESDNVFIRFLCETPLRLVNGKEKKGTHPHTHRRGNLLPSGSVLQGVLPGASAFAGAVLLLHLQASTAAPDDLKDAVDRGLLL